MEIIGKTASGFIVSIPKDDLEMLTGHYYGKSRFYIGQKLVVDKLYNQLTRLTTHEKDIKKLAHSLKTAAGMLEKIDPVFEQKK